MSWRRWETCRQNQHILKLPKCDRIWDIKGKMEVLNKWNHCQNNKREMSYDLICFLAVSQRSYNKSYLQSSESFPVQSHSHTLWLWTNGGGRGSAKKNGVWIVHYSNFVHLNFSVGCNLSSLFLWDGSPNCAPGFLPLFLVPHLHTFPITGCKCKG